MDSSELLQISCVGSMRKRFLIINNPITTKFPIYLYYAKKYNYPDSVNPAP